MVTKFDRDLATGEAFEQRVLKWFSKHHKAYKIEGYFKDFDLVCECCGTTIECKYEPIAARTGNFFFSFPLLESPADYLFEGTPNGIYRCKMDDLRYWVGLGAELGLIREASGNEGEWGYIVPINHTHAYMKKVL